MLLVNSHSFTSLMFPCSNLLGFSSFWLHCTGTRFWNQEKKRSMDMQSVSHSPEGHRLPCHCSNSHPRLCSGGFPTPGQILSWGTPGPRAGPSCKPHRTAWGEEPSDWKCPHCCPPRATGADGAHNHSAIHQHPSSQKVTTKWVSAGYTESQDTADAERHKFNTWPCRATVTADDTSSALTKALSFHFKTKRSKDQRHLHL